MTSSAPTHIGTIVPFFDSGPSHAEIRTTLLIEISQLIESGAFINGPHVGAFETSFARYCNTADCVGVASGLDGLRLGLIAAGIEPGDEVIVPANTFVATLEAVTQAGGVPVPVDVRESDYNLDPAAVDAAISDKTRFLMPVHLYGQMADMRALSAIADQRGLVVIEDACQAHGADRDGLRAGETGVAAAFSFYPAKNLGAMGDAGALVTSDQKLAGVARALREHGQTRKYHHEREGFTARLDTIQALVLLHKLPFLDRWNEQRRAAAVAYTERLTGVGDLVLPSAASASNPVWHLYVVQTRDPQRLAEFLGEQGIGTGRHYPEPAHLSPAYAALGYAQGTFPVTEGVAGRVLSLPIFPGITENQIAAVVDAVSQYFN
jgi:dTDP-4-amino-4,6-dideoxygalactose transaminase